VCLFLGVVKVDVSAEEASEPTTTLSLCILVNIVCLVPRRERWGLTDATSRGVLLLLLSILASLLLAIAAFLAVALLLAITLLLTSAVALLLSVTLLRLV
jgi:hypothetical protein